MIQPHVFRLLYPSQPGQSLWLHLTMAASDTGLPLESTVAMQWRDAHSWEAVVQRDNLDPHDFRYHYELRTEDPAAHRVEAGPPRHGRWDPTHTAAVVHIDSWRSPGALDAIYHRKALQRLLPPRGPFASLPPVEAANHTFELQLAAVPVGQVPCLIGSVREIGDWQGEHALPLQQVAPDVWQRSLYLPCDWAVEYKYGLYDPALGRLVSIETGENRLLAPRDYGVGTFIHVSDADYRRQPEQLFRGAGVAVPVFSLRSAVGLGIGEFADLIPLADWAKRCGLKLIQILPISDTTSAHDWTDSYPYAAISAFALHPVYLRLTDLVYPMAAQFQRDFAKARTLLNGLPQIDHPAVMTVKTLLTRQIFTCHRQAICATTGYQQFLAARPWLIPYAVFCIQRDHYGTADTQQWQEWAVFQPEKCAALAQPGHPQYYAVAYHIWLQWELDRQLTAAVAHLHAQGLVLKGDLPIGIDRQSADAWTAPQLFHLEMQTGAPPDDFAVKGQNWGFPTYDWPRMQQDGYSWWQARFAQLSRYFDVYRIDHILGFFRIWQIPASQVEGIMGRFEPAIPIALAEFAARGISWDHARYCQPYLTTELLAQRFGDSWESVQAEFLEPTAAGRWQLAPHCATQQQIAALFPNFPVQSPDAWLRERLFDCVSEVLLFEVAGSAGTEFHPRYGLQATHSFQALDNDTRGRLNDLYNDYFYHRQEDYWRQQGLEKLPAMVAASEMLLCGEDLGMVPACVPGVLQELGILALEIQRMPKSAGREFTDPAAAPYLSVVSPSSHDTSTLRGWWQEDPQLTARYAAQMLGSSTAAVAALSGETAAAIIRQHLQSPAMWAIFPLQDLLAIDETLRLPDPAAERINVPAIVPHYWRYRLHLGLEDLLAATALNDQLATLITSAHR
jgi:4-alpha-glucanotransferase